MITRYENEHVSKIWSDVSKYRNWWVIERAAVEVFHGDTSKWVNSVGPGSLIMSWEEFAFDCKDKEKTTKHDVAAFVEVMCQMYPKQSKLIHRGMTSSDVVDTGFAIQLSRSYDLIGGLVQRLMFQIDVKALQYKDCITHGLTHGQYAEPMTHGLRLKRYVNDFHRAHDRLLQATEGVKIGKLSGPIGAYTGTTPIQEEEFCEKLELHQCKYNTQIVARDRHAEWMFAIYGIAAICDRFATELRMFSRSDVRSKSVAFSEDQIGSSSMPHKKNPISEEKVCGLARLIKGYTITAMENINLWHERDISHSSNERIIFPDACHCICHMLSSLIEVSMDLEFKPDKIKLETLSHAKMCEYLKNPEIQTRQEAYEKASKFSIWDSKLNPDAERNQGTIKRIFKYQSQIVESE